MRPAPRQAPAACPRPAVAARSQVGESWRSNAPASYPRRTRRSSGAKIACPVSHLVTAERDLMNGAVSGEQIVWVLIASAALTLLFAPLTVYLCGRER